MPRNRSALMCAFNKKIALEFEAKLALGASPSTFDLTPQQSALISAGISQDSSILAEAVAGAAKTYSLLQIATSIPAQWTCKTMHGLGYSAWSRKIGKRLTLSDSKNFQIAKKVAAAAEISDEEYSEILSEILAVVRIFKTYGIVPSTEKKARSLTPDDPEAILDLCARHDLEPSELTITLAHATLAESIEAARDGKIDFNDMLYMPVIFRGVFDSFDTILVDEVQDLSLIQHEMLRRLSRSRTIIIAAGDRYQSIYGFRGALSDSIPQLISDFSMQTLPLTVSFRCPQRIVAEAQEIVPHIEPSPFAKLGHVFHPTEATLSDLPEAILCRNTAPLITLGMRLLSASIPVYIVGREIGKTLISRVKKICTPSGTHGAKPELSISLRDFTQLLANFTEAEIARKPKAEERLRDQENAINAIGSHLSDSTSGSATVASLIEIIENLYGKTAPGARQLSTIHRAKGLEFPSVGILDPNLMPSKYAKQPWQLIQERNLQYVAITRSQDTLSYLHSDDILG